MLFRSFSISEFCPNKIIIRKQSEIVSADFSWPLEIMLPYPVHRPEIEINLELATAPRRAEYREITLEERVRGCNCSQSIPSYNVNGLPFYMH